MAGGSTDRDGQGGEGVHGPHVDVGVVVLGVRGGAVAGVDLHVAPLEPGKHVPFIGRVERWVGGGGVEADVLVDQGLIAPVKVLTFGHGTVSARWEGVRGFVCLFV